MRYSQSVGGHTYTFDSLKDLLAKATPARSGDYLAGIGAGDDEERVAAQMALADLPLSVFLSEAVIPYEDDEVTRLIVDGHDKTAFAPISHLTVGGFRDWLLARVLVAHAQAEPRVSYRLEEIAGSVVVARRHAIAVPNVPDRIEA